MVAVAFGDANRRFDELLRRVEAGEEVVITRNGQPIARLVPSSPAVSTKDRRAIIDRWLSEHSHVRLNGLRLEDLMDEGRRG